MRKRHRWLLRRLPVLAALMDQEGRFLDVSDELCRRLGVEPGDLKGRTPVSIASPDSARRIREEHLPQFRRTGRLDRAPVEFIGANDQVVSLLATTIAEYDDNGAYMHSLSIFNELTDRQQLEERYRALYHATPAILHTVDAEGRIMTVSDHWLEKLGYTRDEVVGRSILGFLSDEAKKPLLDGGLQEVIASGNQQNVPRQMLTKSNELIDVVMSSRTEIDPETGLKTLFVASKDVTERNRAEAKLREAYGEIAALKDALERERDYLREEVSVSMNFGRIVGRSPALQRMTARIESVADTPTSVLIVGETGTGKELVAHAIHAQSGRRDQPLVKVNCASIPAELFESEFFGHVRGAFTGAHQDRVGRFQLADGGTLFLDEVGEIPLALQGKLLRVLQEKEFERVGEDISRSVDVRVIAATNKDLQQAVLAGEFRQDLYYRLGVFPVEVPPLRERGDDVLLIALHVLNQICRDFGREPMKITQSQAEALRAYDWPGNVRELKNVIERAVILSPENHLRLDLSMPGAGLGPPLPSPEAEDDTTPAYVTDQEMRENLKLNIVAALEAADWKVSGADGAAQRLGLKPSTLTDRMRAMQIKKPRQSQRKRA